MTATALRLQTLFGGRRRLKTAVRTELDLAALIRHGVPLDALDHLLDTGRLSLSELDSLVIPRRTLSHRRGRGERLSPQESDRLMRVARVVTLADEVFGTADAADRWLRTPNRALGETPLDLLDTDGGARAVEAVLTRIAHGVYS